MLDLIDQYVASFCMQDRTTFQGNGAAHRGPDPPASINKTHPQENQFALGIPSTETPFSSYTKELTITAK